MKRLTLYVICLSICVMGCGVPVASLTAKSDVLPKNTSTQIPTETSTKVMTVCNSGGLNIRPEAGDLSSSIGWKNDGDTVTVLLPAIVAEDMGLWYELLDGGFVNSRFLCVPQYVP